MNTLFLSISALAVVVTAFAGESSSDVGDFLKRADSGEEPAILGVAGDLYLEGRGVDQDWERARGYYRQAVSNGVDEVAPTLALLEFVLSDGELFRTNRAAALKVAVKRDPAAAAEFAKKDLGIPVVDALLRELAVAATPHDGRWHGIESAEEWSANIRTNRSLMTSLDFCEKEWLPFIGRKWFGEEERKEPWYREANALVGRVVKNWWRTQGLRIEDDVYAEANRLVGAGCGNVVVNWIAGLSRQKEESLRWFDKMEVEAGRFHSPELARFLIAMARRHWMRTEEARRKSVEGALAWVKSETFTKAESRSLYRTLAVVNHPVKKEMAAALGSLPDVDPDIATALAETGGGLPVFPELGAELIKDSPPDTDRIFASASERMIDDCTLNFRYIFYNCLPRWGGSVEMIERFGNACFDADRFDSMLPLAYLDAQFFLASERDIPLERHFADKVRFSRCMKAADALVGNMNIHSRARHAATYYKAMLTYCGGDLSTLRTFFTEKYVRNMPPVYMIEQAEPYGAMVGALAALSGADAEKTVPLHEKFRSGRYDEFIAGAKALAGEVALTREAQDYLRMYSKIASLKSPGYDGSWIEAELVKSDAEFFTRFPQWHRDSRGQGWFVPPLRGNRVPIKWNMPLGDEFEVVVGLNPLMGVSHAQASIQYWVSHYDRQSLPEVLFELENGEIRVWLMESGENVENRWHTDSRTTPYRGGVISVRVQYKNGRVSVWLGDGVAANLTSDRFAPTFAALKGRGGSSVICAKGLCVRSWKGRSTPSRK